MALSLLAQLTCLWHGIRSAQTLLHAWTVNFCPNFEKYISPSAARALMDNQSTKQASCIYQCIVKLIFSSRLV